MDWITRTTLLAGALMALSQGHPHRRNMMPGMLDNGFDMFQYPGMFQIDPGFSPSSFSGNFWKHPESFSEKDLPAGFKYEHSSSDDDDDMPHKETYRLSNDMNSPVHIDKQYETTSDVKPGHTSWKEEMHQSYSYQSPGNMGNSGSMYFPYGSRDNNDKNTGNLEEDDKISNIDPSKQGKDYFSSTVKVKRMDTEARDLEANGPIEPTVYSKENEDAKPDLNAGDEKPKTEQLPLEVNKSKDIDDKPNVSNTNGPPTVPTQIIPYNGQTNGISSMLLIPLMNTNPSGGISRNGVPAMNGEPNGIQILYTMPNSPTQSVPLHKESLPNSGNPTQPQTQSVILTNDSDLNNLMPVILQSIQQSGLDLNRNNQQYNPGGAQTVTMILPNNSPDLSLQRNNNNKNLPQIAKNMSPSQGSDLYNTQQYNVPMNQQTGISSRSYNMPNANQLNQGVNMNRQAGYVPMANNGQLLNVQQPYVSNQNNLQAPQPNVGVGAQYPYNGQTVYLPNQLQNQQGNLLLVLPNGQIVNQGNAYLIPQNNLPNNMDNLNNPPNQSNMYTLLPVQNSATGQYYNPNSYAGNRQDLNGFQVANSSPNTMPNVNDNPTRLSVTKDEVDSNE